MLGATLSLQLECFVVLYQSDISVLTSTVDGK